jgi:hypothetical protein
VAERTASDGGGMTPFPAATVDDLLRQPERRVARPIGAVHAVALAGTVLEDRHVRSTTAGHGRVLPDGVLRAGEAGAVIAPPVLLRRRGRAARPRQELRGRDVLAAASPPAAGLLLRSCSRTRYAASLHPEDEAGPTGLLRRTTARSPSGIEKGVVQAWVSVFS